MRIAVVAAAEDQLEEWADKRHDDEDEDTEAMRSGTFPAVEDRQNCGGVAMVFRTLAGAEKVDTCVETEHRKEETVGLALQKVAALACCWKDQGVVAEEAPVVSAAPAAAALGAAACVFVHCKAESLVWEAQRLPMGFSVHSPIEVEPPSGPMSPTSRRCRTRESVNGRCEPLIEPLAVECS